MKRSERILNLGANHRVAIALILLAITVAFASALPGLRFGTDFSRLIADSDPDKLIYQHIAEEFGSDNRSIVYARDTGLFSPEHLGALQELHHALERLPFAERVDSLFTLRTLRGREDQLDSRLIIESVPTTQEEADRMRARVRDNPLVVGRYVTPGGTFTALVVTVAPKPNDPGYDSEVSQALDTAIAPFQDRFDQVFQLGPSRITHELNDALAQDLRLLGPLSAIILVATVLVLLRSGFAAVLPLVTASMSVCWTFGLMAWLDIQVTLLTAMLPSLIIAVGSTEDTHLMAHYLRHLDRNEPGIRGVATRRMMRILGVPLGLTVLTTALGFGSNAFSQISLIQEFALISTFAILSNGIITWLLVPLLTRTLGPRSHYLARSRSELPAISRWTGRVFGFTRHRFPRVALVITALLCGFFLWQASKLTVTNDPMSYFKDDRPLITDMQAAQRDLAGMKVFFITLSSDRHKAFLEPDNLRRLLEIQSFILGIGSFDDSLSIVDFLKLVNREFHNGDREHAAIPNTRELVAQYLMLFHRSEVSPYISADFQRANIVVRHSITDSSTLNRSVEEIRLVAGEIAKDFDVHVVGENLMINRAADTLLGGQVQSLGILLLMIFLVMSAMFTSFKGGLIAMIPAFIPIVMMFGVMGLLEIPLNPGTAMVAVIAVGIAVDGTVHLLSRYNERSRRVADNEQAIAETVEHEALPAVTTAVGLALGFGVLLFSQFSIVAQFGALSAATMLFSIVANLLITPLIMTRIKLVGLYQILSMSVHYKVLTDCPLFRGMTPYEIRKAILISQLDEFCEGDDLVRQGEMGRTMYLILEGEVDVVIDCNDGTTRTVAHLGPGQVFGEIGFVRPMPRTATVVARSPVQALRYDYATIGRDLRFFPSLVAKMNFNISGILGERLAGVIEGSFDK
ncbi:MAG: MMPL family transporter [Gammaproteobacteria bacterium]